MKKQLKMAAVAALLAVGFTANAQITTTGDAVLEKGTDDTKIVKLIDNKGTIKYLQSKNGITQITSTSANNKTVTTWQLGGILEANTYIEADASKEFALDGLKLVTGTDVKAATGTIVTDRSDHAATAPGTPTGFTVLIRDEDSGAVQKIKLDELLKVNTIGHEHKQLAEATVNQDIAVANLPAIADGSADEYKLFVFRNGAKLRLGVDFTVTPNKITIVIAEVPMYKDDVVEIQYIK